MDQALKDEFVQDESKSLSQLQETILFGIARYWMPILICSGLGLMIGIYMGAAKPNVYKSEAKLLLRFGQREGLTAESLLGGGISRESEPTMEDEIHMLNDDQVFKGVVSEVGPEAIMEPDDPKRYDDESTPIHVRLMHELQAYLLDTGSAAEEMNNLTTDERLSYATAALRRHTLVMNDGASNVIQVLHWSTSPERAQEVLSRLVSAFIERHRDQFSIEKLLPEYEKAVEDAGKLLADANADLDKHIQATNITDLGLERELTITRMETVQENLAAAKTTLNLDQAELNQRKEDEASGTVNIQSAESLEAFQERLVELSYSVQSSERAVEGLENDLKVLQTTMKDLAAAEPERRRLMTIVEQRKSSFDERSAYFARVETLATIDVEGDTNLSIMQGATKPLDKEGPKRLKLLILGLAAGTALGVTLAVLRQAFESSLRYPTTVQRSSGIQLLAVIPESTDVRRLQRVRQVL